MNSSSEARVRWGFGWNENDSGVYPNGNQASNDVSGGIRMTGVFQTGINRSARVEIFI